MVKARIMGDNDGVYASELRAMLRPFVFRRYIDFSVIQSLRNMKGMIAREVRRRGLKDNIKLMPAAFVKLNLSFRSFS